MLFCFLMAGDDLNGASQVVILLLVIMSAGIDDLKEEKSSSVNEYIVGPDGKRVGSADVD
jgi:hypothetical protein